MRSEGRGAKSEKCLLALLMVLVGNHIVVAEPFWFDDIDFWVGEGANRAAMAVDWVEDSTELPALVWGYRWDGVASGADMLTAVVAADARLFAKLGNPPANPVRVYGLGYDADNDGQFGIDDGTDFDEEGIAYSGEVFVAAGATDPGDFYAEGWHFGTGFWHYGIAPANPYDGGSWADTPLGMATRTLADGAWDSWAFSPTFNFTAFAENPSAGPAPGGLPGDYNGNGMIDAADYTVWRDAMTAGISLANDPTPGTVDNEDFAYWRSHFGEPLGSGAAANLASGDSPGARVTAVPEPSAWQLATIAFWTLWLTTCRQRKEND